MNSNYKKRRIGTEATLHGVIDIVSRVRVRQQDEEASRIFEFYRLADGSLRVSTLTWFADRVEPVPHLLHLSEPSMVLLMELISKGKQHLGIDREKCLDELGELVYEFEQ